MKVDWAVRMQVLSTEDPQDLLDALLGNLELTADSDDPTLRAELVIGEERLELGTMEELLVSFLTGDSVG